MCKRSNARRVSRLSTSIPRLFRGHLKFDLGDIWQTDPEYYEWCRLSFSPSRSIWQRQGEETETLRFVISAVEATIAQCIGAIDEIRKEVSKHLSKQTAIVPVICPVSSDGRKDDQL